MGLIRVGAQRLDKACFGRWHQLREHSEIRAAGGTNLQRRVEIDTDHVAARREPQLALAGEQDLPSLMLLRADQGVLAVRAEPSVGPRLALGARETVGHLEKPGG